MNESQANVAEFTVSELSAALKRTVEDNFGYVRVRGEISGYKGPHGSGHVYFALKDQTAKIDGVIWKGVFGRMRIKPEEGMEVIVTGKLENRMNAFNMTALNPVSGTPGVITFAGRNGVPRTAWDFDGNNFGPRAGFAWTIANKTVARGGYGLSYTHFNRAGGGNLLPINGPQVINAVVNQTPTGGPTAPRSARGTESPDYLSRPAP